MSVGWSGPLCGRWEVKILVRPPPPIMALLTYMKNLGKGQNLGFGKPNYNMDEHTFLYNSDNKYKRVRISFIRSNKIRTTPLKLSHFFT